MHEVMLLCMVNSQRKSYLLVNSFFLIFIEIQLIYNIVLVSDIRQGDSAIYIYKHTYICIVLHYLPL